MKQRRAKNRVEVDLLPPVGKPTVTVFGPMAKVVALALAIVILSQRKQC